ncbi:MAG TPA: hypothetical protein VF240_07865 [Pyrinomonadaceae bacterium]
MEQDEGATSVNRSERTLISGAERASRSPRFDEGSIRRAQPAVPLGEAGATRRGLRRPSPLVMLAALAAVVGLVAGAVGASVYMSRRASPREASAPAVETAQAAAPPSATAASEEELFKPAASDLPDVSPPAETTPAAETGDTASADDEQATLREALGGWLSATNARDIGRQMSFYDTRLDAFYLSRNTSARSVRAEKVRVLGSADLIDIQASGPAAIRLGPDGRTAVMRFRKRYRVAGGGQDRRGEVVQELRWRKTGEGWKIVSERDVRVIN